MLDALILRAIAGYQRHLSPRKGYRCAHSVLHGGDGCSGAIYRALEEFGLRRAAPMARRRFHECHLAAQILRTASGGTASGGTASGGNGGSNAGAGSGAPNRNRAARRCEPCDCDPCLWFDIAECLRADALCSHAHAAPCDCASCDVGACDISACCECHPFH